MYKLPKNFNQQSMKFSVLVNSKSSSKKL
ncbi:hypothetical protein Goarm_018677 [Gossypium armourianum]|uniref:Uncharacterized protein n=1 Tax=Gossypium armourianum TaxID=34283 RepID=A0A7J9II90_9ROSI|nr:hypothetical protein [Gossypium armourianum]